MLCANQGQPLILRASRGAAVAYLNIAKRLLGQKAPLIENAISATTLWKRG